ncbi:MAG: O-antigen ligase family protein [Betaproteobacteria bacterium]|nr:O-antigen ligase family protein [Betaproteobacteria bacterium]
MNATAAAGATASERICALAAAAFLVVAPVTASSGLRVALLAVAALALGHLAFHHGRDRLAPAPPTFVSIPLVLWAALATASLAWSVDPAYTRSELRAEIAYGALAFCVFYFAADGKNIRLWAAALLAGTAVLAVTDLARAFIAPNAASFNSGAGRFTTHLVLAAPFFMLLTVDRPAGFGKRPAILAGGIAVFFAAALASQNRIVWGAFLVSLAVLGGALVPSAPREFGRKALAALGILGAAIVILFGISMMKKVEVYTTARNAGESLERDVRPRFWAIATGAIADRPLAGHGFGRDIIAPRFRAEFGDTEGREFAAHGHNLFLNAAVSLGAAGLAALTILMAALALAHARNLARPATRIAGAIGLALVAGFLVKNLTDDFFNRHNALVFWALNGMLIGFGKRPASGP